MLLCLWLCERHRKRVSGPAVEPGVLHFESGMNVLIGSNGSGKSTVLDAIINQCEQCRYQTTKKTSMTLFDSEKQNPRTTRYVETMTDVLSLFHSHGEMMRCVTKQLPDTDLMMMDEPEAALDLDGVFSARRAFESFVAPRGGGEPEQQIIVATHHPLFWFGNIITLGNDPRYMANCMRRLRQAISPTDALEEVKKKMDEATKPEEGSGD